MDIGDCIWDIRHWILDIWDWIMDIGHWGLDIGDVIFYIGYLTFGDFMFGHWRLEIEHLDVGHWI